MYKQFTDTLCGKYNMELNTKITEDYPWFTLGVALLIRDLNVIGDTAKASTLKRQNSLSFSISSYRKIVSKLFAQKEKLGTINVIDSFLNKPSHKIPKITNETPTNLTNAGSEELKGDIVTEQFAKILSLQGHKERAIAIYNKLSLKYPEKSVYFANCIDTLTNQ